MVVYPVVCLLWMIVSTATSKPFLYGRQYDYSNTVNTNPGVSYGGVPSQPGSATTRPPVSGQTTPVSSGTTAAGGSGGGGRIIPRPSGPQNNGMPIPKDTYTATAGRPFDIFSGISHRQLALVQQQWEIVKQRAASGSGVAANQGARIFGKFSDYLLTLWLPQYAPKVIQSKTSNGTNVDGGGQLAVSYWDDQQADFVASRWGRDLDRLIFHLVNLDSVGYIRAEDDVAYAFYVRHLAMQNSANDIVSIFTHKTNLLTAAVQQFLGNDFTPEIESAFRTVWRWISWHLYVTIDGYLRGDYSRFTPFDTAQYGFLSPLDLIPAERDYPLQSNGTQIFNTTNLSFGPVDPDGNPLPEMVGARALSNDVLPRQPTTAPGAPDLNSPPLSATVGKAYDPFSGITYEQLDAALVAFNNIQQAAANASGVPLSDGLAAFFKNSVFIYTTWHPEFLNESKINNSDQVWSPDAAFDVLMRQVATDFASRYVGLCKGDIGQVVRSLDSNGFFIFLNNRARGESWNPLAFFAWITDAYMADAEFYLGDTFTDEQYSGMLQVFSFLNLNTFEAAHTYTRGYRKRPFSSDFDKIGPVLAAGLQVSNQAVAPVLG